MHLHRIFIQAFQKTPLGQIRKVRSNFLITVLAYPFCNLQQTSRKHFFLIRFPVDALQTG